MNWLVDASVIVAVLGREPDWVEHADRLDAAGVRLWSPVSQWESTAALRLRLKRPSADVGAMVTDFAGENGFVLANIGTPEAAVALEAFQRYGQGTGHRAQLNMGDCFAYACAPTNNARLLYKGDNFIHTDLGR